MKMRLDELTINILFTEHLKNKNYSKITIRAYSDSVKYFFRWLKSVGKNDLREVRKNNILEYAMYLDTIELKDPRCKDRHYSRSAITCKIKAVKILFKFLMRNEYILINPFDSMDLKAVKRTKDRKSIDVSKLNNLLDGIKPDNVLKIRDRAIYELMYGTGLRVSEITKLDIMDIDLNAGKAIIRQGKGRKDRIIPLGNNVINWLKIYLGKARKYFLKRIKDAKVRNALFFSQERRRITEQSIGKNLKKYFKIENEENICPHIVRHSFATHMLDNGAGIKYVKDILGHSSIQTTVIYTHFSIKSLKRIMKMYHPRENELYEELKKEEIEKIFDNS